MVMTSIGLKIKLYTLLQKTRLRDDISANLGHLLTVLLIFDAAQATPRLRIYVHLLRALIFGTAQATPRLRIYTSLKL